MRTMRGKEDGKYGGREEILNVVQKTDTWANPFSMV